MSDSSMSAVEIGDFFASGFELCNEPSFQFWDLWAAILLILLNTIVIILVVDDERTRVHLVGRNIGWYKS